MGQVHFLDFPAGLTLCLRIFLFRAEVFEKQLPLHCPPVATYCTCRVRHMLAKLGRFKSAGGGRRVRDDGAGALGRSSLRRSLLPAEAVGDHENAAGALSHRAPAQGSLPSDHIWYVICVILCCGGWHRVEEEDVVV